MGGLRGRRHRGGLDAASDDGGHPGHGHHNQSNKGDDRQDGPSSTGCSGRQSRLDLRVLQHADRSVRALPHLGNQAVGHRGRRSAAQQLVAQRGNTRLQVHVAQPPVGPQLGFQVHVEADTPAIARDAEEGRLMRPGQYAVVAEEAFSLPTQHGDVSDVRKGRGDEPYGLPGRHDHN